MKRVEPGDIFEVTGFHTWAEYDAYTKGRDDQETVTLGWIKKYNFTTNSQMGQLLMDKIKEYNDRKTI